jgi:hypothetical protein
MPIPNTYEETIIHAERHRKAFGLMLKNWRLRCGWTQYTYCDWAVATGHSHSAISYGNLSVIEQGTAGELRHKPFWQLWEMNRRIAHHDWGDLSGIEDELLLQRLNQAFALGDDDTPLWGPTTFWACYNGLHPVPQCLLTPPAPVLNAKNAKALSSELRKQFQERVKRIGRDPLWALGALSESVLQGNRQKFIAVLMGMDDYDSHELQSLWDPERKCYRPQQWAAAPPAAQ